MIEMVKKYWVIGLLLLVGVVWGYGQWGGRQAEKEPDNPVSARQTIWVGKTAVEAEVRLDDQGRELGLSYRLDMAESEGMLFVFPEVIRPLFWMKGMKFDLDMVWIKDGRVVEITERVPAPENEKVKVATVSPKEMVDSVLEVKAGWVEKNGVVVGDEVVVGGDHSGGEES